MKKTGIYLERLQKSLLIITKYVLNYKNKFANMLIINFICNGNYLQFIIQCRLVKDIYQ
jgi:hypothetical protein